MTKIRRLRHHILDCSGRTVENQLVVSGISKFIDTHGLPLTNILEELKSKELTVDWVDYLNYSLILGCNLSNTVHKIEESVREVYGKKYTQEFMPKIQVHALRLIGLLDKYEDNNIDKF